MAPFLPIGEAMSSDVSEPTTTPSPLAGDRVHVPAPLMALFLSLKEEAARGREAAERLAATEAARRDAERRIAELESARQRGLTWMAALETERRSVAERLRAQRQSAFDASALREEAEERLRHAQAEVAVAAQRANRALRELEEARAASADSQALVAAARGEAETARTVAREAAEVARASHQAAQAALRRLQSVRREAESLGFWGRVGAAWRFLVGRREGTPVVLLLPEKSSAPVVTLSDRRRAA